MKIKQPIVLLLAWALAAANAASVTPTAEPPQPSLIGGAKWKADYGFRKKAVRAADLGLQPKQVLMFSDYPAPSSKDAWNPFSFHERWLVHAIQGMTNRTEPLVWIGPDGMLRKYYQEQRGYSFVDRRSESFAEFLKRFAPHFNGVIVYAEQPSDCAMLAFNLANQNFCLPVSETIYQQHREALDRLPMILRIGGPGINRRMVHDWLVANLLPRCDRRSAFSVNQAFPDNSLPNGECSWDACGDIPFRFGSFIFNLSGLPDYAGQAEEFRWFQNIMEGLKAPAMIFGWNTAEAVYSAYGHTMGHCQNAGNSSFIASVPSRGQFPFKQDTRPRIDRPEKNVYVAFVSNEGDTLRLFANGYWGAWQKPERGAAPMNWAICPAYVEYFPTLFEYYYETRTTNDYFCMSPTGAGYVHTDLMPPAQVDVFLRETERLSRDYLDLHEIMAWGCNNLDVWQKMAAQPSVRAIFPKPNGGPDQGRLFHIEAGARRVPVLREGFGHYWITRTPACNHDQQKQLTPSAFATQLQDLHATPEKPAFFILYSLEGDAPRMIKEMQALLDPARVQIVDLCTFSHLLRQTPADFADTPREADVASPVLLTPELIREPSVWKPVNGARVTRVPEGLKIELVNQTWGGISLTNVKVPTNTTGLTVKTAAVTRGRWEPRLTGLHVNKARPDNSSMFVGIQATCLKDGPYPGGVYRSDFDPRVIAKIRRGEILPQIQLIFSDAKPGDYMVISKLEPHSTTSAEPIGIQKQ